MQPKPAEPADARPEGEEALPSAPLERFLEALAAGRTAELGDLERAHPAHAGGFQALRSAWDRLSSAAAGHLGGSAANAPGSRGASGSLAPVGERRLARLRARLDVERERYRFSGEIARGGMGSIQDVWDEDLGRRMAMKVMLRPSDRDARAVSVPPDGRTVARFLEEVQIMAQLDHPGILPVHDLGIDGDGRLFFTMPLVQGREFGEVLRLARDGEDGWTPTRALGVLLKVVEAVAFAHTRGVVHRDLKPENVMVGRFGETYVMDWGLARILEGPRPNSAGSTLGWLEAKRRASAGDRSSERSGAGEPRTKSEQDTLDGDIVGTPGFMAPEQACGDHRAVGPAADIYSLGAILYQLLTGHPPHLDPIAKARPESIFERLVEHDPTPPRQLQRDVSEELCAIAAKAMRRDPAERYARAEDLAEDLRAYLEGRVVQAHETGLLAEARKWVLRNRLLSLAYAALVLTVLGGGGLYVRGQLASLERIRAEQARTELARAEAVDAQIQAEAARRAAELGELRARSSSYSANLRAAELSLSADDPAEARRRLAACPEDLRGFEWHHLWRRANGSMGSLGSFDGRPSSFAQAGSLWAVAGYGEDGWRMQLHQGAQRAPLASATAPFAPNRTRPFPVSLPDRTDLRGGQLTLLPSTSPGRVDVVFAPTAERRLLRWRWNGRTLDELPELPLPAELADSAAALAGSRESGLLAVGIASLRFDGVLVFDGEHPERAALELPSRGRRVQHLGFDPIRPRLVVGHGDGTLVFWDLLQGTAAELGWDAQEAQRLPGSGGAVDGLAFSPDGRYLAVGSQDGSVRLLDPLSGGLLATLRGHAGTVRALSFSPDGRRLATAGEDRSLRFWRLPDGAPLGVQRGHLDAVLGVLLLDDGERAVSVAADGETLQWDADALPTLTRLPLPAARTTWLNARFWPDDQHVLVQRSGLELWDTRLGEAVRVFEGGDEQRRGGLLTGDGSLVFGTGEVDLTVWSAAQGQRLARLRLDLDLGELLQRSQANYMAVGAHSRWVAVGTGHGDIGVWDLTDVERWGRSRSRGQPPDERTPLLRVDLRLEPDARLGDSGALRGLALCDQPPTLYAIDQYGRLRVWSVETGALLARLDLDSGESDSNRSIPMAVSPDGTYLAIAERDARGERAHILLLDLPSLERRAVLEGHEDSILELSFGRDSRRLVSASEDRTVRVWDPVGVELLLTLRTHEAPVQRAELSRDGMRMVSVGRDQSVHVHETASPAERFEARRAGRVARRVLLTQLSQMRGLRELTEQSPERLVRELEVRTLGEPAVQALQRLLLLLDDAPARLNMDAWDVVRSPGASPEAYQLALWRARAAVERVPDEPIYERTLGLALYRNGQHAEALRRLESSSRGHRRGARPEELAVRALCLLHLDRADETEALRTALDELLGQAFWGRDPDARALSLELEEHLRERMEARSPVAQEQG